MTGVNVLAPLFPPVSNEDLDEDPFDELDEDAVLMNWMKISVHQSFALLK